MSAQILKLPAGPTKLPTVVEETYCDLDRVVATLDIVLQRTLFEEWAEGAALELMREKLFDLARRLEAAMEEGA